MTMRSIVNGTLDYSDANSGIDLDLRPLDDGKVPTNVYTVIGSDYNDVIIENSTPHATIYGGLGDDTLSTTGLFTTFDGGSGTDTVSYSTDYNPLSVDLTAGVSGDGDSYVSIENVVGSQGNNSLTGNEVANVLVGNDLGDLLDGRGGADTMIGGDGNDIYYVDNAGDKVIETADGGTSDKVHTTISYALSDNVEWLMLDGSSAINGTGNDLNNTLLGNDKNNVLKGLDGNDVIRGGGGSDTLYGGEGHDQFVFNAVTDSTKVSRDHIMDFTQGEDRIDLRTIDANSVAAGNNAFHFIGAADYSHTPGELRYTESSHGVIIYGDINGDGVSEFSVSLDNFHGTLKSSDFLL